jgi:hypothetical protein
MLGLAEARQVRVDGGDQRTFVAEVDLDLAEVLPLLEQVRGVTVAQRVDMRGLFHAAGIEGEAEGALQRGAAHRFEGGAGPLTAMAFGGKEPRGMAVGFPLLAQQPERAFGQRDITVLIALASADVQEHAFGINVADLKAQPLAQAQAAGVNEDQTDPMIQRGHLRQDAAHFGSREDHRQFELGIGAGQLEFERPDAFEGFFPEDLEGADGLGAGLAGDFLFGLEMDAILAELLGADQVWGFGVELAELAEAGVVSRFGASADGQEFEVIGE